MCPRESGEVASFEILDNIDAAAEVESVDKLGAHGRGGIEVEWDKGIGGVGIE